MSIIALKIRDVMTENVVTVKGGYSAKHVASIMNRFEIGCLVVVEDGTVMGILTERDLLRKIVTEGRDPEKTKVSEIMSRPVIVVAPDTPLEEAIRLMVRHKIKKLPVMERYQEEDRLIGLVTLTDIARFQPRLIQMMRELFAKVQEAPPKRMEKVMNYYVV
ncbi:MAG: cyclic nucleotide-binding/CBS domain-containing protein [Candidatus Bathyarchaeia archaeon]